MSRKQTEDISEFLNSEGINSISYHAGQDAKERRIKQDRFMTEDDLIITAQPSHLEWELINQT